MLDYYQQKLIDKGLYTPAQKVESRLVTVGELIEEFCDWRSGECRRNKITASTIRREKAILGYIKEFLGAGTDIKSIGTKKADEFPLWLEEEKGLSEGTIDRDIDKPKHLYRFAIKRKYTADNPFDHLKGGSSVNEERKEYVDRERFGKAINALADDPELQLVPLFGRWAALRMPSETRHLKKSDFWEQDGQMFFKVADKKLGTKTGKRDIHVFPELRPYLDKRLSQMEPDDYLFEHYRNHSNIAEAVRKKLEKAGVPVWPKIFNNLRASLMTDFKMAGVPEIVMDKFFGNTEKVRQKHYINLKAVSEKWYAEALTVHWDGTRETENVTPNFTPNFDDPREVGEYFWGLIADEFGLKMSGKELQAGWLSSVEFQQAINDLDVVFTACKEFSDGKIDERQVGKTVAKYLRRTGEDAADSITALTDIIQDNYPARTRT